MKQEGVLALILGLIIGFALGYYIGHEKGLNSHTFHFELNSGK